MSKPDRASVFAKLHQGPDVLVLPNAWDAGSARIIEHAGAKAIATSSAAVAWASGYPDGEALPAEIVLQTLRAIARVVDIPVSADIEAAYAQNAKSAAAFVARVIDAGAVGINIEDGTESPDLLCAKIEAVREMAEEKGVALWINARTDVYLRKLMEGEAAYKETVARAKRYAEAGASSIFIPGVTDEMAITHFVRDIALPINLLAWPGLPPVARLKTLGVRRLSAGSGLAKVMLNRSFDMAQAFLAEGHSEAFSGGELPNINSLMRR